MACATSTFVTGTGPGTVLLALDRALKLEQELSLKPGRRLNNLCGPSGFICRQCMECLGHGPLTAVASIPPTMSTRWKRILASRNHTECEKRPWTRVDLSATSMFS